MYWTNGGPVCNCCGETEVKFLSIDHVRCGGNQHRQSINQRGHNFYVWLKRNNFPAEFQVLCMNCQFGRKHNGGICPHRAKLGATTADADLLDFMEQLDNEN